MFPKLAPYYAATLTRLMFANLLTTMSIATVTLEAYHSVQKELLCQK